MQKLKFDLQKLSVESFETGSIKMEKGTVKAHEQFKTTKIDANPSDNDHTIISCEETCQDTCNDTCHITCDTCYISCDARCHS